MFDFKQWRTERKWTQAEAAEHVFGLSQPFWGHLEQGKIDGAKAAHFARCCELYTEGLDLDRSVNIPEFLEALRAQGLNRTKAAEMMGLGKSTVSNLIGGYLPFTKRWRVTLNAFLIMCKRDNKPLPVLKPVTTIVVAEAESFEKVKPLIIKGEPLWIVADVCRSIDHSNPSEAVKLIDSDDLRKVEVYPSIGQQWATNEAGLYTLLLRSNLPKAKPFRKWVTSEVLPTIRKTGGYQKQATQADLFRATADLIEANQRMAAELAEVKQIAQQAIEAQVSTRDVITDLQRLNHKKSVLQDYVMAIVNQAATLPESDLVAAEFKKYQVVWRSIHRSAKPPVSKIADYTTLTQIQTAINAAESLLIRLGGIVPAQQLEMEVQASA